MKIRTRRLLEKSVSAAVAAIEIYNKPNFEYREENFCILMLNAWELLFKAKLIEENKEVFRKVDGAYQLNRSGNQMTIDLFESIRILNGIGIGSLVSPVLAANIEVLTELRDNSIHFYNQHPNLSQKVLEVGMASVKSYNTLVQEWFDQGLEKYNFFLMPLAFYHGQDNEGTWISGSTKSQKNLLRYIAQQEDAHESERNQRDSISLRLETKLIRSHGTDALEVRITNNPDAPEMRITEEQKIQKYRWPYYELNRQLSRRYSDFRQTPMYHELRKEIHNNPRYHWQRFNNPLKPESGGSHWYTPEVLEFFDKHYKRK